MIEPIRALLSRPIVIGITGGSGSGKTTFATGLRQVLGENKIARLSQDSYYRDRSADFDRDGGSVNFDHPDSLEFELMAEHLRLIKRAQSVQVPIYDFATHSRRPAFLGLEPRPIIVLDGILLLAHPDVAQLLDLTIFVDAPEAVRFERRLERDVRERGRTPEGVREQFFKQVKPMHDEFVEPARERANLVIDGQAPFDPIYLELARKISFDVPKVHLDLVT